jgi:hypothetical protein
MGDWETREEALADAIYKSGVPESHYAFADRAVIVNTPWRYRARRFFSLNWISPVWVNEPFWLDHCEIHKDHFLAVSETDPTCLAYYQNEEKGCRNVRTPIKPGRYLTKFFGHILTEKQIADYANWQLTGSKPSPYDDDDIRFPLQFAHTPDEIEEVYSTGPNSCMSGRASDFAGGCHPARVYGAGDLAIAYLAWPDDYSPHGYEREAGDAFARTLVWPDRKVYGRIYPTPGNYRRDGFASDSDLEEARSALEKKLRALGYESHYAGCKTFEGARLLKIESDRHDTDEDVYVMPYLDLNYCVEDCGDYFRMSKNSGVRADETDGTICLEAEHEYTCEHCDRGFDENATDVVTGVRENGTVRRRAVWCEHCAENTFYCDGLEETVADYMDQVEVDGTRYCRLWAEANGAYQSDYAGDWYFSDDSPMASVSVRHYDYAYSPVTGCGGYHSRIRTGTWSLAEAEDHAEQCAVSGAWVHPDVMVTCAVTQRRISMLESRPLDDGKAEIERDRIMQHGFADFESLDPIRIACDVSRDQIDAYRAQLLLPLDTAEALLVAAE